MIDKATFHSIPKRAANSHKGCFGKAIAFVGSRGMSGAARLSATAILKSGAGMATAAVPEDTLDTIACGLSPAVMTASLPKGNMYDILSQKAESMDVVLMGCGIGASKEAVSTVRHMLESTQKPIVLDADGLNAIAGTPSCVCSSTGERILTPHIVEFSRISGYSVSEIKEHPMAYAKEFAQAYGVTLVLKDAVTIVATKEGKLYISTSSNSGMATAGSGDVLAGIITGLLAQGADSETAAVCGVYLHLAAGELARRAKGEYGMTAEDLLEYLPMTFMEECPISFL